MRATVLALCLATIGLPASALSQECDPEDESQMGMNICADAAYRAADARLNKAYGAVRAATDDNAGSRRLLVEAQRAWIAFRDAECAFSTEDSKEGSIYPMLMAECLESVTDERTKQLEAYIECPEGDLSCPTPAAQ
ncbi:lysozyme inhibitor LprI family protein [Mesorhizobium sp. KR9-304]|uniref:lysozyme inhibitor LprI family protein n=1 Tax=Mesorhizobium sp. KR9-304 TaxID=3156614 RepID=UPI0032B53A14